MEELVKNKEPLEVVNEIELAMTKYPEVKCPLFHTFTPNLYIREIHMPAGSLITSKCHKTQHPFIISKGAVSVLTIENGEIVGEKYLEAPYRGITEVGTRRVLYIHENCVWTTIHSNHDNETDVDKIEERIIEKHVNPLLVKNEMEQIAGIYKRKELEIKTLIKQLNNK